MYVGIYGVLLALYLFSQIYYAYKENKKYEAIDDSVKYLPFITVIVPFYNEKAEELEATIDSILAQNYPESRYEIICIDDGSVDIDAYVYASKKYKNKIKLIFQQNQGKRVAQQTALKAASPDSKYLLMVDSDSVLTPNTMIEMTKTIAHYNAKAVTGGILVKKEKNLLNYLLRCRYWISNFQERLSQSYHNQVMCCSGPCSIWERKMFEKVVKDYVGQTFMGTKCTYGDDRHLTNLFLKEDAVIKMSPKAFCFTKTPDTWMGWFKQQLRWSKSFYRELLYCVMHLRGKMGWYFLYQAVVAFVLPFVLFLNVMLWLILGNIAFITVVHYVLSTALSGLVRGLYAYNQTKDPTYFLAPIYGFVHFTMIFPIRIYALFRLKDMKWGTR